MSKEMKSCLVYSGKSERSLGCIRVNNDEQGKEMNLEGEHMPYLIRNLDFTLLHGRLMKTFYSKVVKSSDSCLEASTLAVVCSKGGKQGSQECS